MGNDRAACARARESEMGNEGYSEEDGRRERCCTGVCRRDDEVMTQADGRLLCNAMCKNE